MSISKILASQKLSEGCLKSKIPPWWLTIKPQIFIAWELNVLKKLSISQEAKGLGRVIWKIQYILEGMRSINELCEQDEAISHLWNFVLLLKTGKELDWPDRINVQHIHHLGGKKKTPSLDLTCLWNHMNKANTIYPGVSLKLLWVVFLGGKRGWRHLFR